MLRFAAVLGVLASVLAAGARGASSSLPCTRAAAKAAMLASPALRQVWPTLRVGGGVGTLICHDFTRDGARDMAATVFSGGTAGDIAWVVFRQRAGRWSLALRELQVYKVGLYRVGGDLVESTPAYRQNDPNCCERRLRPPALPLERRALRRREALAHLEVPALVLDPGREPAVRVVRLRRRAGRAEHAEDRHVP